MSKQNLQQNPESQHLQNDNGPKQIAQNKKRTMILNSIYKALISVPYNICKQCYKGPEGQQQTLLNLSLINLVFI